MYVSGIKKEESIHPQRNLYEKKMKHATEKYTQTQEIHSQYSLNASVSISLSQVHYRTILF